MLCAGACAYVTSSLGGALAFLVDNSSSSAWWGVGSAFIYIILLAGASADNAPALGGALPFDVVDTPSWAYWNDGSAI